MRLSAVLLLGGLLILGIATPAWALEGFVHTGSGVRVKKVLFVSAKVYDISHYMRSLPKQRTRSAVIEADVDKVVSWRMLRDVGEGKIRGSMKSAYALNGYRDDATINQVLTVFLGGLREGEQLKVSYDTRRKATTFARAAGRSVTIVGTDFMRATWSMWFGKSDQPSLGDDLIRLVHASDRGADTTRYGIP